MLNDMSEGVMQYVDTMVEGGKSIVSYTIRNMKQSKSLPNSRISKLMI